MKHYASVWLRLLAGSISLLFITALYQLAVLQVAQAAEINQILNQILILIVFLCIIYPLLIPLASAFLVSACGGGIGKILTGLEIVDKNDHKISLTQALVRQYIGYYVSTIVFNLGFIWIAIDQEKRGFHDMIADTYVIVKNSSLWVLGVFSFFIIVSINLYLTINIFNQFTQHKNIYLDTFNDFTSDISTSLKSKNPPEQITSCTDKNTANTISTEEAVTIATTSECTKIGTLTKNISCNENSGTVWIDLNLFKPLSGCSPACVVDANTLKAEINYRCTGLKLPTGIE